MQGKGAIRFFAIALSVACIYSLSFTFVANNVENKAKEYANGDPKLEKAYLDSMATETVFNLGFAKFTYQECKQLQLNLGLDLKGGMNVTMEISLNELVRSLANNSSDTTFNHALNLATQRAVSSQKDFITLFGEAYKELAPNGQLAAIFATPENKDRIKIGTSNDEVLKVLKKEAESAVDRSFNILRTRIDKFGVTQPNIQLQQGSNRVLIELPGVDDPERVRKLLQGSAQLEFWDVYSNYEIFQNLDNANKALKAKLSLTEGAAPKKDTSAVATVEAAKDTTENELALLNNKTNNDTSKKDSADAEQSFAKFASENPLFALLNPNIGTNEQGQQVLGQGPVVGFALLRDTAKVNEYLSMPEVRASFPSDVRFLWGVKAMGTKKNSFELYAIRANTRDRKAPLGGEVITDARDDFDQKGNPEVVMVMNAEGAKTWKRLTAEASKDPNNKKSIAIVLDNYVYSAPTVQNEIPNGISSISGSFTANETKDLANVLKAGKLPAPARIVEEAIVGPSLGQEAINAGLISSVVGLIVVLIFMVLYYNTAGVIADLALFTNVFFIMGIMASLGAVLTLPGIAGIVLTIGMSVDANVLIYERVREELEAGKAFRLAIADGFKNAYSSIIDANVVTLLSGIILYAFGSGPILGFASTLIIGILTSLFAAIFITRLIFEAQIARGKMVKFSNKMTESFFKNANFDFLSNRKVFYAISGVIITAGLISLFVKGLSFGVDFKGGRNYTVRFDKEVSTNEVRDVLTDVFGTAPEVKTFGSSNQVKITTSYMIDQLGDDVDKQVEAKLAEGLTKVEGNKSNILSSQKVGPTIANDIKRSAVWAILLSLAAVFFYIFIRFKKWQFGVGALVSLAHDVLILLSLFSIFNGILPFSLDIDQQFIAAVLTVMGYSMNDTVVIFDRVREYMSIHHTKNEGLAPVINHALNSTLSRTMVTGLTTMFVLVILFFFGGEILRGFSFAMLIGVIFGTYSSLFVATPIVVDMMQKDDKK
jgi:SecD/SecF fusion protein